MQAACAILFFADIAGDLREAGTSGPDWHLTLELAANGALVLAIIAEALFLRRLAREQARTSRALSAARGALDDLMRQHFDDWGLTPSEADVAHFTIKGFSIAEIAGFRKAAEGTVKSQLNAIYRKSGLSGRNQLVSVLIEDLLNAPAEGIVAGAAEAGGGGAGDMARARL